MPINKGKIHAQKLLSEFGLEDLTDISLEDVISARDIILQEKSLINSDGRIVFGKHKAIITINSDIEFPGKRRFTLAHELGHYEMHRKTIVIHNDTDATLEYFKNGHQETEANQFATELLMPSYRFADYCSGKVFSPDLLRNLSNKFSTSITSVAYRYLELGQHPIFLFYSHNNKVKYWKNSSDYYIKVKENTKLPPPSDSVAAEFFDDGTIYRKEESKQKISKSTWFELSEDDEDTEFYEYCIITPKYNTVLSIVWEE